MQREKRLYVTQPTKMTTGVSSKRSVLVDVQEGSTILTLGQKHLQKETHIRVKSTQSPKRHSKKNRGKKSG